MARAIPVAVIGAGLCAAAIIAMRDRPARARSDHRLRSTDLAVQAALTDRRGPYVMRWCTGPDRSVCR